MELFTHYALLAYDRSKDLAYPALSLAPMMAVNPSDIDRHRYEVVRLALSSPRVESAPSVLDLLAAEVAIGVVARNADVDGLILAIRSLDKRQPSFRNELSGLLLLRERAFHVLAPVTGARIFGRLVSLDPDLKMRQVTLGQHRAFSGWDVAGHQAREFTVAVTREPIRQPGDVRLPWRRPQVLSMDIDAYDRRAAATIARRRVAEILDQYVAGHPWARFEIVDGFGVAAHGESDVRVITLNPPSEDSVTPLAVPWPTTLRQAMRVSHLVREATAPMTRVALAWVTIEAAGVQPTPAHFEALANALALLLMRQSIFLPYRLLVQDSLDRERGRQYERRRKVTRRLAGRRRAQARRPGIPYAAAYQQQYSAIRSQLLSGLYGLLCEKYQEDVSERRAALTILNASVNPDPTGTAQPGTYLRTMHRWAALLGSTWETSSGRDASSLRQLLGAASSLTRSEIGRVSDVVRSPSATAKLLSVHADWMAHVRLVPVSSGA
jgi:hypothetical protein